MKLLVIICVYYGTLKNLILVKVSIVGMFCKNSILIAFSVPETIKAKLHGNGRVNSV